MFLFNQIMITVLIPTPLPQSIHYLATLLDIIF